MQRPPIRVVTRGTITRGGTIARATTRYGAAVHVGHVSTEPSGQTRISSCRERTRVRGSAIVSAPRCHPPTRHARSLERGRRAESNAS